MFNKTPKETSRPIQGFRIAVGAYSRGGGLLTICSTKVGAFEGGFFEGEGGN